MPYLGDLEPGSPLKLDDKRNIPLNNAAAKYMRQRHHMDIHYIGG